VDEAFFLERRQRRIREQLRDAVTEVRQREGKVERDKRTRSVVQHLQIDEVEALLEYVNKLEVERG
jgi:hypothetical protein